MGFSDNYSGARAKFVDAGIAGGAEMKRYNHPLVGPDGTDLSVDLAWYGPRDARKVIVAMSGVHGVEGFFGSAVQSEWMQRQENRSLGPDVAALMIHAVNPYGFAWLRRGNEDNVDLNRNWIDFSKPAPHNTIYGQLDADLCPTDWSTASQERSFARLLEWRDKLGIGQYLAAVTGGQWSHPKGLFYGGAAPAWSRDVITRIVEEFLGRAVRILILDFHTGLGPHGYVEQIIHRRKDDSGYDRAKRWTGAAATSLYGGGRFRQRFMVMD